jgi:CelD/BcsL family acetyltransferase involved in cellulose biosynthesis
MSQRVQIVLAAELPEGLWGRWTALSEGNPDLDSPYFHPAFVRGLIEVGRKAEVAVFHEGGDLRGFFPFERRGRAHAVPAGWPMADFQAPVCAAGFALDVDAWMRAAGLESFLFDHLLVEHREFFPHVERVRASPFLDVSGGLEAYRARLGASNKRALAGTLRLLRKARRDLGEIRLDYRSRDASLLHKLIDWKRRQYRETGADDFFADPAHVAFLERLLSVEGDGFHGALSALWAGEKLLALHMGMAWRGVLHWWFPSYDVALSAYSPGRLMLAKLAEEAPALGLRRIDLGKGEAEYKRRAMTGARQVAEGFIDTHQARRWLRRLRLAVGDRIQGSALYGFARDRKRRWQAARCERAR